MSDTTFEISMPTDNDGYVLFQCPNCGEYFKITPSDYEAETNLENFCPACGLAGENYITEDVIDLAMVIAQNYANDLIYNEMKKWERKFNKGMVTFKAGKKPKPEYENPIRAGIETLSITSFTCCRQKAKIKPLLKFTGCYCPFCGVKNYEVE
jgi:predicted RNA-binding Zn-ribbon protein involved in translation (DUF1610 family)